MFQSAGLVEKTTTIDGFKIFYHEGGKGANILLIHGFGGFKEMWTLFAKSLTPTYHVTIIDLPDHGKSSKLLGRSYRIEMQVERLKEFVRALELAKFSSPALVCYQVRESQSQPFIFANLLEK